ncbi:hypothetical protein TNCT_85341 [Trichonephila clavata]|uniref:RNase H type-1 domain-containing protein n=1 Tax=Trichonephila clavata TaxID=2740835 RepID=A0A8X6GWG9_TRICU|nr:hypothetical protein TNCT_85341 [Trichonephila clavata]
MSKFIFLFTTGKFTTTFDGEVAILQVALAQLHRHLNSFTSAVGFRDSKAVIFDVESSNSTVSSNIFDCKKLLQSLSAYFKEIVLQWISGHCVVSGNELVNHLAKKRELPFKRQQEKLSLLPLPSLL